MKGQLVQDWMTRDPITIIAETPLPEIRHIMGSNDIRHLPVMDNGKLVGIVTWGDVREASPSDATTLSIYELNYLLDRLLARHIMTPKPFTVTPMTTIASAAAIMRDHKISSLPVVSQDKLVGIITENDIFRMLVMGKAA